MGSGGRGFRGGVRGWRHWLFASDPLDGPRFGREPSPRWVEPDDEIDGEVERAALRAQVEALRRRVAALEGGGEPEDER
jgi:hypothetical protein